MSDSQTVAEPVTGPPAAKPAIGAIVSGVVLALLGYLAALGSGMASAPSNAAANVTLVLMVAGVVLALCGLASIWLPRLRRPARIGNYVVLALIALAFVVNAVIAAFA
ncbi:MAG: hypothetical protein ABIT10_06320 [Alteraurantiacibacter sp.]